jgi:hypothetical protein
MQNIYISGIKGNHFYVKYAKQDHQRRAAFNGRNPYTTQQHRTTGKKPSRTPDKNRTGHRAQGKARTGR